MNKQKRKLSTMTSVAIMTAAISAFSAAFAANAHSQVKEPQIARIQPLIEQRIEPAALTAIFDGTGRISIEDIKGVGQQPLFDVPQPMVVEPKVIQIRGDSTIDEKGFAQRTLRVGETIRYYEFNLTLKRISSKTLSAFFVVTAGEDEWNFWLEPSKENKIRYNNPDHERSFDLIVRVDKVLPGPGGLPVVDILLQRDRVQPGQTTEQTASSGMNIKRMMAVGEYADFDFFGLELMSLSQEGIARFFAQAGEDEWELSLRAGESTEIAIVNSDAGYKKEFILTVLGINMDINMKSGVPIVEIVLKEKS